MSELLSETNAINTTRFTFHNNVYVAEISDFGRGFRFHQIYDDACDEGLTLQSEKTGQLVNFYVAEVHHRDGDLTHWTLKPTPNAIRKCPRLANITMEIFND